MIVKLDEKNFEKNIKDGLKLVEFFAPWCGFCMRQEPILKEMEKIWIGQINADDEPKLAQKFEVEGFPTFLLFKNGQEIERFSGLHSKYEIMSLLSKYIK